MLEDLSPRGLACILVHVIEATNESCTAGFSDQGCCFYARYCSLVRTGMLDWLPLLTRDTATWLGCQQNTSPKAVRHAMLPQSAHELAMPQIRDPEADVCVKQLHISNLSVPQYFHITILILQLSTHDTSSVPSVRPPSTTRSCFCMPTACTHILKGQCRMHWCCWTEHARLSVSCLLQAAAVTARQQLANCSNDHALHL